MTSIEVYLMDKSAGWLDTARDYWAQRGPWQGTLDAGGYLGDRAADAGRAVYDAVDPIGRRLDNIVKGRPQPENSPGAAGTPLPNIPDRMPQLRHAAPSAGRLLGRGLNRIAPQRPPQAQQKTRQLNKV